MGLRIISGDLRGKKLRTVHGKAIRPTADRLRESIFNILSSRVLEAVVLDLFAGTGALGIEALSRGAEKIVFIDQYYPAIKVIKTNISKVEAEESSIILHRELNRAVIHLAKHKMKFDLIFLDPGLDLV